MINPMKDKRTESQDEYRNFSTALSQVLRVSRTELKARMDAEKRVRKQRKKRPSGHASDAKD
jgi:hypothetical protein